MMTMAQHFLLSAAARTLSLKAIYKAGEEAAYDTFRKLRWPETDGGAICPRCGSFDAYDIASRRKFKCAACHHQFSVTSGTIFASRKLSFVDLLAAICIFVTNAKGMSAVQFSRTLDVQYKTAWVMAHKLREALAREVHGAELCKCRMKNPQKCRTKIPHFRGFRSAGIRHGRLRFLVAGRVVLAAAAG
jgi:transposase-like protein